MPVNPRRPVRPERQGRRSLEDNFYGHDLIDVAHDLAQIGLANNSHGGSMLGFKDSAKTDSPGCAASAITSLTLDAIRLALTEVATEHGRELPSLFDDLPLARCGLESTDMAIVIAKLEDALGVNPFAPSGAVGFSVTAAEFVRSYDRALAQQMFIDLEY